MIRFMTLDCGTVVSFEERPGEFESAHTVKYTHAEVEMVCAIVELVLYTEKELNRTILSSAKTYVKIQCFPKIMCIKTLRTITGWDIRRSKLAIELAMKLKGVV